MDTRNIANAFIGSDTITGMYFGTEKVWPQTTAGNIYDLVIEGYSGSQADFTTNRIQGIGGATTYAIASYAVTSGTASVTFTSGSEYEFRGLGTFTTNGIFSGYIITSLVDSGACKAIGKYALSISRQLRRLALPSITTHESGFNEMFNVTSLNLSGLITGSGIYGFSGLGNNTTLLPTASFPAMQTIRSGSSGIAFGGRYEHFGTNVRSRFYNLPECHTIEASGTWANNSGISGIYAPKLRNITASIFVGSSETSDASGSFSRTGSI